jgi:dTDP-glucose 4,6-dehydratase
LAAPAELVVGEVFNIGANEERSSLENAHAVLEMFGLSTGQLVFVADRLGHGSRIALCSQKLRQRLGWHPQVCFQDGLAQTIVWYRDNSSWLEHVLARHDAFLERALRA